VPGYRAPFEPVVPGAFKVPDTDAYRSDLEGKELGLWAANRVEEATTP